MRGQTSSSKIGLMPRLGWSTPLTRSIQVKEGPALRTLNDARVYLLDNLPENAQARQSWQKAAELLLAAADGLDDVGAATGRAIIAAMVHIGLTRLTRQGTATEPGRPAPTRAG